MATKPPTRYCLNYIPPGFGTTLVALVAQSEWKKWGFSSTAPWLPTVKGNSYPQLRGALQTGSS